VNFINEWYNDAEKILEGEFGIEKDIIDLSYAVEQNCENMFSQFENIREYNQLKVLNSMQKNRVSDSHFAGSTGYGYGDTGRDVLDKVFSDVFKTEDALVRQQIVSGTHAIALCLFGNLKPGDELLSVTGKPYDTLDNVIGIANDAQGSLKQLGISFKQVDLLPQGEPDFKRIKETINKNTKMVFIQRSRGYNWRPSLKICSIENIVRFVKNINKDIIILVDNCYGEFVEKKEPTEVGADIIAGSLIKNPGGGLAPSGGYIAGKGTYVKNAAFKLTAPGIGKEVGASLGVNRLFFQGLFLAPHIVAESLKGAVFAASLLDKLEFEVSPAPNEKRGDIIQAVKFKDPESLILFCQGIQKSSPVDSFITPVPWDMPGYDCKVIMAAGGFVQGASIELSADAPIKEPYIAYLQGGLVFEHVKLGVMTAINILKKKKAISTNIN